MKYILVITMFVSALLMSACGGGSDSTIGSSGSYVEPLKEGYVVGVSGLDYECGDIHGVTDSEGMFACREFPVTFKVGKLTIGTLSEMTADSKVYPQDMVGKSRDNFTDEDVVTLTRLLESIKKSDGTVENTIFDQEQNLSQLNNNEVQTLVEDSGKVFVGKDTAIGNLKQSIQKLLSISVKPENTTLALGESLHFTATGIYSDGSQKDITQEATWDSLNPDILSIYKNEARTHQTGEATVQVSYKNIQKDISVTVTKARLVSLTVEATNSEIVEATTTNLVVNGTFGDGTTSDVTTQVTWDSEDETVATVDDSTGVVTAHAAGKVVIVANHNGIYAKIEITVIHATLQSITVAPTTVTLLAGESSNLLVTGVYSNGKKQIITSGMEFNSTDLVVASVSQEGAILAQNAGEVTITTTVDGFSAQTKVTVLENQIRDLLEVHNNARIEVGVTNKLTWDETIVKDAQSYANEMARTGVWEHDPRNHGSDGDIIGYENGLYGENLYASATKVSLIIAAQAWVDEKAYYHYGVIGDSSTCDEGKICGHYTQVIWKNTSRVGCATSQYLTGAYKDWYIVVCKYQKPGNYLNETPY